MKEKPKNGVNKQVFQGNLRLPKLVEADPRAQELIRSLTAHARPLWPGGKIMVPHNGRVYPGYGSAPSLAKKTGKA